MTDGLNLWSLCKEEHLLTVWKDYTTFELWRPICILTYSLPLLSHNLSKSCYLSELLFFICWASIIILGFHGGVSEKTGTAGETSSPLHDMKSLVNVGFPHFLFLSLRTALRKKSRLKLKSSTLPIQLGAPRDPRLLRAWIVYYVHFQNSHAGNTIIKGSSRHFHEYTMKRMEIKNQEMTGSMTLYVLFIIRATLPSHSGTHDFVNCIFFLRTGQLKLMMWLILPAMFYLCFLLNGKEKSKIMGCLLLWRIGMVSMCVSV